jgi:ketosteroid isomerase-like protein
MRFLTVLICFFGLSLAALAQSPTRDSNSADLAVITAFNKRYLKAINDGDVVTLSQMTSADHIMMIPGRPEISGKAANDDANRRAFEQNRYVENWNIVETVIQGTLAFQRGTFTSSAIPKAGGPTRTTAGKLLRIYRRQTDGSWSMYIDSFSSDAPGLRK